MSKNNKNKKKQNHDEVFMQICNNQNGEEYMLKVPSHYKYVLNRLMDGTECTDYHNSQEMLQFFCELFTDFTPKKREEFETVLNSKVATANTISDLVVLALSMHKYYRIKGVDTKEKLGRFHILAARARNEDSQIANATFDEAKEIGEKVKREEGGKFYSGDYIGVYTCFEETDE